MLSGGPIQEYTADIIRALAKADYEIKTLGYYLFTEAIVQDPDNPITILAVSTILKDFMTIKNYIRMNSLKAISTIYSQELAEYIDDMLIKAVKDKNVVIRRAATVGISKALQSGLVSQEKKANFTNLLEYGIRDFSMNSGLSIIVFFKVKEIDLRQT